MEDQTTTRRVAHTPRLRERGAGVFIGSRTVLPEGCPHRPRPATGPTTLSKQIPGTGDDAGHSARLRVANRRKAKTRGRAQNVDVPARGGRRLPRGD